MAKTRGRFSILTASIALALTAMLFPASMVFAQGGGSWRLISPGEMFAFFFLMLGPLKILDHLLF